MAAHGDPVEDQIRRAIDRGEFDDLPGAGRPLRLGDDSPGWWAKAKFKELRRRERLEELGRHLAAKEERLWALTDEEAVLGGVAEINDQIGAANADLAESDRLPRLDPDRALATWRRMYRLRR